MFIKYIYRSQFHGLCNYAEHAAEVDALVDRANKDIAIESLLNTFEEVWLSKHFDLQLHQRVADTGGQEVSYILCTFDIELVHKINYLLRIIQRWRLHIWDL